MESRRGGESVYERPCCVFPSERTTGSRRFSPFATTSEMPSGRTCRLRKTSAYAVHKITGTLGQMYFSSRAASTPFIRGMDTDNDQLGFCSGQLIECVQSVVGFTTHVEARELQLPANSCSNVGIIINDENRIRHATPLKGVGIRCQSGRSTRFRTVAYETMKVIAIPNTP